jgi:hypothetical protein
MSLLQNTVCRHCGQSAGRLLLFALMQDAGAHVSNDAIRCYARDDEGDHDFVDVAEYRSAQRVAA